MVTIVGVTADFVQSRVDLPRVQMLLPLAQHPVSSAFVIARGSAGNEMSTLPTSAFETAVRDADPIFFRTRILTGERLVNNSVDDYLNQSALSGGVSLIVLALAALGVCGVIGFMSATRTREIAVRIALGASPRRVLGMMLSGIVKLVMPGVVVGLLVGAFVVRMVLTRYQLGVVEPLLYTVAATIVVFVALLAGLSSARRAASAEPMVAMRSE